jgi:hypothetical protein
MVSDSGRQPFHWKGFVSLLTALVFLVIAVSGVVLYLAPRGRTANWSGWDVWGVSKEGWGEIHMVAALLFLAAAAFHLYFNWTSFASYFKARFQPGFNLKREFVLAVLIVVLFVGGTVFVIPPFAYVGEWNMDIKDYWEAQQANFPYPHAEESTLDELARRTGRDAEALAAAIREEGYALPDGAPTVADIAEANDVSPADLFGGVFGSSRPGERFGGHSFGGRRGKADGARASHGEGEGRGSSRGGEFDDEAHGAGGGYGRTQGYGRMSVREAADAAGVPVGEAVNRLKDAGIEARASDSLRELADAADMAPRDIAGIIDVE